MKKNEIEISAIDLFCGVGGLTHGLEKVGINVKLGVDIDPACEFPYTHNNGADFLLESVERLEVEKLKYYFGENNIRLLAGCAPCQTFSTYNQKASPLDKRWSLLKEFSKFIKSIQPELVTMENVPKLIGKKIFRDFVKSMIKLKYNVEYKIIESHKFGVPQHRKRLVLLASKLGPIKLLEPTELKIKSKTVREAIAKLDPISAGERSSRDSLHVSANLSALNLKRIKASKAGGTWRDWDKHLIANCHRKKTGKHYASVYGRMKWDEPSPTLTTQFFGFGNGRFGHPDQDRAISLREGAILQSFPKNYKFTPREGPISQKTVGRLIGNAVPVKLGEVIGLSIIKHVEKYLASDKKSNGN